jgi:C4-dicarboxylate-binding protein DctP
MRSRTILAAAALAAVLAPAAGARPAESVADSAAATHRASITIRIGFPTANDIQQYAAVSFAREVATKSKGRIAVKAYPAGALGSNSTMLQNVVNGSLTGMIEPVSFLAGFDPAFTVLDLHGLFKNGATEARLLNSKAADPIRARLATKGLAALAFYQYGGNVWITKFDPSNLDNFKGKKIRVIPSPALVSLVEKLGAAGVPMDVPQVYTAFQQGTIDGVQAAEEFIHTQRYDEIGKYLWQGPDQPIVSFFIVNQKWLQDLAPADRKIVQTAAAKLVGTVNASAVKRTARSIAAMKAKGITVVKPNAATSAKLDQLWAPIGKEFLDKNPDALPIYNAIKNAK